MKVRKIKEEVIDWTDKSLEFQNVDITTKLKIADTIEKVEGESDYVKYTIALNLGIETEKGENVISGLFVGQYIVLIEGEMTLDQFSFFYKRPYTVFKTHFDNYKKGKHIDVIKFPEFIEDLSKILSAFKERIPDLLSS